MSPNIFQFSTKAVTLEQLAPLVTRAHLCEQVIAQSWEWRQRRDGIVAEIVEKFGDRLLAVRSSAAHEDGAENSYAGVHLSCTNVGPTPCAISKAVDDVFSSYTEPSSEDQVLVQPMVSDVAVSGVVLTRDLDTGSPYYVVSYDDFSGRTDTVTSGAESKTFLVHRSCPDKLHSARFRKLIDSVIELEQITSSHELDIEFCITRDDTVFVLQVRPLAARRQWDRPDDTVIDAALDDIRNQLAQRLTPMPGLAGQSTVLGEMPDWNPAEMIGNAPRPLALSLYKHLITDDIWAKARTRMGYRRVDAPLLVDFCGRPYIDTRLSFNSFLPDGLDEGVAGKLVDHQISQLLEHHEYHDKIEFEVAVTCRDFSYKSSQQKLEHAGVDAAGMKALENGLARITGNALKAGADGIEALVEQSNRLLSPDPVTDDGQPLEQIRRLLADCKSLGTLPFAQLARHGFIGVLFLKSLVDRDAFSQDDADQFMRGIHTVTADLVHDMHGVATGAEDKEVFLRRYGHLRPATYDILSARYDERPDLYLGHAGLAPATQGEPFNLRHTHRATIESLLAEFGYSVSPEHLLKYIVSAIKGREQAKFAFTRSVSDALVQLARWGETKGLSRDDLSFLTIESILEESGGLREQAETARDLHKLTRAIRLPHLIGEVADVDVVRLPLGQPTFITSKQTTAKTIVLDAGSAPDIDGHIVLIESADPGFDWIFLHPIEGLITKFGGANSHMAIRCAEFGLPAAIGCGERLFNSLAEAPVVELNCAARKLSPH